MKSANSSGSTKAVIKHQAMRQEVARLSTNLSRIGKEAESAGAEASDRPEENAAESMENGCVCTALAVTSMPAPRTRTHHIRAKITRDAVLRKKGIDQTRSRFPTQGAGIKRAEKGIMPKETGTVHKGAPSRLKHWQNSTRQQIFLRHAAKQKLGKQSAASSGMRLIPAPPLPQHHPRGFSAMRSNLRKGVERILNKGANAIAKAVRTVIRSLLPLIGAGSIVLLLMMVIGAAAAIIGSPMGILFADETSDPNAVPISSIVQNVNASFAQAINGIVAAHPECDEVNIQYVYADGRTWASYWPEVLAVFAAQNNLGADGNVIVIDAANAQMIQNTFWEMHQITSEIETVEIIPETDENEVNGSSDELDADDEDEDSPTPQYRYILHISVKGKSADEMADRYHFTADQRDILHQLLSAEMRSMLEAPCGGALSGAAAGDLQWPLPGFTTISCQFGEPDAIRGLPHKGTDIPAPEGTPIVAAHDGTVLISGWNDSYGNQVLIDNGAGLSTRYAHMIETAVNVGDTVSAGQVIGYVGSTGDSTGNHLHFEVTVEGVRVDPLAQTVV